VDEPPPAQEGVEVGLACSVAACQTLERALLIGRVVIDVHAGVGLEPADQIIDELLGESLLPLEAVSPPRGEGAIALPQTREVLTAGPVMGKGVTLEVEIDIARAGCGQRQ